MEYFRYLRKTWTFGALRVGMEWSRRADDPSLVEGLRCGAWVLSRTVWPLRAWAKGNMQRAGVWQPGLVSQYFDRAIDQMIMLAHVFRAGTLRSGCLERFRLDESFRHLREAYDRGRGVLVISPHICGYPFFPEVITQRIPCVIYLRRNKDNRKMRVTAAIGEAGISPLVYPPAGASKAQRLAVAVDVLRKGQVMFITPDTPRKPHEGIAVQLFGKTVYYPTGPAVMALRTGASIVPAWWWWDGECYRVRFSEPLELTRGKRLRKQTEDATRTWAGQVDHFFREHPDMWWNWLDKRWNRILREKV